MEKGIKHTPGPWSNGNNGYIVRNGNNDPVASTHYTEAQSQIYQEQQLANARLIAAAPDMLEALKMLVKQINSTCKARNFSDGPLAGMCDAVKTVIAKAEAK